ncbi:MAG: DUF58 domain-containing protein [Bacteroidales bacterium]|nr:DUF58 domain-containing protein [Bacteroidales bacterium]
MDENEIMRKVRTIEIKAKGLSRQLFSGEYHSAFKGRGMEFSEVREYQYGDDVRNIDWNVTARLNHPYVKVFNEERELTVMLLVDVSGSTAFGTRGESKRDLIAEVAATLAFSAISNNDKVGCLFFSDEIEKFIPPKKGSTHILRIIRELITFKPKRRGSDLAMALRYFTNAIKKRSTAFLLSDFATDDPGLGGREEHDLVDALKIAAKKHDLTAVQITDKGEETMPDIGLQWFRDLENDAVRLVDTSSPAVRTGFARRYQQRRRHAEATFQKYGIDNVVLRTGEDFAKPLIKLFQLR